MFVYYAKKNGLYWDFSGPHCVVLVDILMNAVSAIYFVSLTETQKYH